MSTQGKVIVTGYTNTRACISTNREVTNNNNFEIYDCELCGGPPATPSHVGEPA